MRTSDVEVCPDRLHKQRFFSRRLYCVVKEVTARGTLSLMDSSCTTESFHKLNTALILKSRAWFEPEADVEEALNMKRLPVVVTVSCPSVRSGGSEGGSVQI